MKAAHYITLGSALTLTALLYWGGNTIPPVKKQGSNSKPAAGANPQGPNTMKAASFDSLLTASRMLLPKTAADSVKTIENELTATRDSKRMAVVYLDLAGVWERNNMLPVAAYYKSKGAKLENSGKSLTFAGQNFLKLLESESSPAMQLWEATQAQECLETSLRLDTANEETKLALATTYIEGTGEPMRGVAILRAITAEKPDDIPANMLLGRMSLQSGQNDKAVKRFETVLKVEPANSEAMFFLAQAYEATGNKQKAIELLQKCKAIVNKPEFSKEIDQHLSTLK